MKKIVVLLLVLCTINWMYLSENKLKWGNAFNEFPIVKYKVNPEMIGFNTGDALSIIDAIRDAGNLWSFQKGESHFQLSYNGSTSSLPAGYDQMSCTEEGKKTMRELDNLVYASNVEDTDCSGQACTFMWSCADKPEILHFDMQLNAKDFEWDMGTNHKKSYNLFTIVANQFGQLLGLGHCSLGLDSTGCQEQVAIQGTSNPTSDSLVYKFIEPEVIRTSMSSDDKAGLKAIYGDLTAEETAMKLEMQSFADKANAYCTAPCVTPDKETNPKYALSAEEQDGIQYRNIELSKIGRNNFDSRKDDYKWFQKAYTSAFSYTKIPAEEYMRYAIEDTPLMMTKTPKEFLKPTRISVFLQILHRQVALEEQKYELDSNYYEFLKNEVKVLIQIRRALIDEYETR
jgi:hypothetical protein